MASPPPKWVVRMAFVGLGADSSLVSEVQSAVASASPGLLLSRLESILTVDARPALQQCQVPLLSIQATKDRLVPGRVNRELHRQCPRADAVVLDGPHLLLQVCPGEVLEAIQAFLGRLSDG